MNIFLAGITSDIGTYICKQFLNDENNTVMGTYRKRLEGCFCREIIEQKFGRGGGVRSCDFRKKSEIEKIISWVNASGFRWDMFISAVGIMSPIERFANVDIETWEENIYTNAISQLRLLRGLLDCRNKNASVYFMTSKGINDTFPLHSAYCLSKILLIKMCELLDDEIDDCKFIAFNPGFINTKIIKQEGDGYAKRADDSEAALDRVWRFIEWSHGKDKQIVSGKNFFVKYDSWEDDSIVKKLLREESNFKMRRCGDTWFLKGI